MNNKITEYARKGVLILLFLWILVMGIVSLMKYNSAKTDAPIQAQEMLDEKIALIDKNRAEETEIFGGPLTPRMSEQEKYEFKRDNTKVIFEETFYPDVTSFMISNTVYMLYIAAFAFVVGLLIAGLVFNFKSSLSYIIMFAIVLVIALIAINTDLAGVTAGLSAFYNGMTVEELAKIGLEPDTIDYWVGRVNGGIITVYVLIFTAILIMIADFIRGLIQGS